MVKFADLAEDPNTQPRTRNPAEALHAQKSDTACSNGRAHAVGDPLLRNVQLHLMQKLQTSLDLDDLLAIFYDAIQDFLSIDSLTYTFEDAKLVRSYGRPSKHSVDYKISTAEQDLGHVTFTRSRRFAEVELMGFEILIGSLFYPLRNALLYRQAVQSSMRDPLTKVGNRMALSQALKRELELAKRFHRPFSLMLIDVDHFKRINDTIGHSGGDRALQHLAGKLSSKVRQIDEVFRYGGEEFVVILSNTSNEASRLVAERIRKCLLQEPPEHENEPLQMTVSIGLSMYRPSDSTETLFERADQALYQAKHSGRNCVVCNNEP